MSSASCHRVETPRHLPRAKSRRPLVVKRQQELPSGGLETCPLKVTRTARWWLWDLPKAAEGHHRPGAQLNGFTPLAGECLCEPHAVTAGLADVRVAEQPVDGAGSQRLGHQLIEPGGMQVRADSDGARPIGGADGPVERKRSSSLRHVSTRGLYEASGETWAVLHHSHDT